jgi:uncharacterized protein YqgC (DUF456 family)
MTLTLILATLLVGMAALAQPPAPRHSIVIIAIACRVDGVASRLCPWEIDQ